MSSKRISSLPPLPALVESKKKPPEVPTIDKESKTTVAIPTHLIEKVRDYCYWERVTQLSFFEELLTDFFRNKKLKKRPPEKKRGPKPKSAHSF